jgi:CHAD domain-containing protein
VPDHSTEREVKLAADRQFTVPDLRDLVKRTVRLPEQRLRAIYFDTPDHRLWARKMTLRHRIGEDEGIGTWTLKLPQSNSGPTLERTELEWVGSPDFVPDRVNEILHGVVRRAGLQKITSLETIRRRLMLRGGRQILLAELDDDMVTIHGGPHDGGRFRQIEVELNDADGAFLGKCIDRLCEAGAWIDERGPKLARALDDHTVNGVDSPSLGPKSTMADVVRASLQTGFDRILDHEYLLRLDEEDQPPEAIHQTRVAARRLRSDLQTFKAVLDPLWVSHTRSDLKWLGAELGLVRDVDVLGQHLDLSGSPKMGDGKGLTGLREQLQDQRSTAAEGVTDVLQSERYLLLLDKLHAAVERPPFLNVGSGRGRGIGPDQRASKALPKVVKRPWKKLYKEVRAADREPTDRQLHQIRIGAKRLRYAAEAAEAVVGKRARRVATSAEGLQTQLGEHHDAVIAEAWLRKRAKGAPSKVAFSAGILAAEQIRRQQFFREDWQAGWEKVDRRAREWLG